MSDPFDPVCVHGVWPLVPDASRPGGIRFADMATDTPGDCVSTPDQLPDAGIELRLFPGRQARDAWCEAVAEFGGNALHASPLDQDTIPAALLVRFDRDRPDGGSVDACIALVGEAAGDPAQARSSARTNLAHDTKETAWRAAWASEIAGIGEVPELRLEDLNYGMSHDRLIVSVRGHRLAGSLLIDKAGDKRRVTLRVGRRDGMDLSYDDLNGAFRDALVRLGYAIEADGDPVREMRDAGGMALRGVMDDLASMEATRSALHGRMVNRSLVRDLREGKPGEILRRIVAGFPLAKAPASSASAYQVNPYSGHGIEVPGYPVSALWRAGAIRPAWWTERLSKAPADKPLEAFAASVWVATDLGYLLAAGDIDLARAADLLPEGRVSAAQLLAGLGDSPPIEVLRGVPGTGSWTPPAEAPQPRFPLPKAAGKLPKRAKDIAQLATWLVNGLGPADDQGAASVSKRGTGGAARTPVATRDPR